MVLKLYIWGESGGIGSVEKNLMNKVEYKMDVFLQNAQENGDDEKKMIAVEDRIKDSSQ